MLIKDRLPDLRRRAAGAGEAPTLPVPLPHPPHIAQLLHEVERIRGWIAEVTRDTQAARALLADPAFHTDRSMQEKLDATVTSCNATGLKLCGALRQLEAAGSTGGAGARIAALQTACLRRAYADALATHHALLAAARRDQLRLLRHHAHIVNLSLSDEECESLLDADNIALFVDNVRAETAEARLALRDAEARHAELRRVEAALREVHALFAQLAALVSAQQGALDSVEHFALQATDHVGDGQHHLLKGSVIRRKAQSKKYGLIICLASGAVLVLMVLILT
ncbi:hypothetical protein O0L34_g11707 [Tuta absoluta]|nr:hypothetical protein O0L34_g11707 [Tuta absoluta]